MLIIPAIDIRGGKCVRLYQGDFDKETVYSDDPCAVAEMWVEQGAEILHVVDLDGAREGSPQNLSLVQKIVGRTGARVQIGGGLRTEADVGRAFQAGAARVVLGTALLANATLADTLVRKYDAGLIVASLDSRNGRVMTCGWTDRTCVDAVDAARRLMASGLCEFVYTDVGRDGTLRGPDLGGLERFLDLGPKVLASGGVSCVEDIVSLRNLERRGLRGVIVGKALYVGRFSLAEAIAVAEGAENGEVTGC